MLYNKIAKIYKSFYKSKALVNKKVFKSFLKVETLEVSLILRGKLFHTTGSALEKARSPNVLRVVLGTTSSFCPLDLKR